MNSVNSPKSFQSSIAMSFIAHALVVAVVILLDLDFTEPVSERFTTFEIKMKTEQKEPTKKKKEEQKKQSHSSNKTQQNQKNKKQEKQKQEKKKQEQKKQENKKTEKKEQPKKDPLKNPQKDKVKDVANTPNASKKDNSKQKVKDAAKAKKQGQKADASPNKSEKKQLKKSEQKAKGPKKSQKEQPQKNSSKAKPSKTQAKKTEPKKAKPKKSEPKKAEPKKTEPKKVEPKKTKPKKAEPKQSKPKPAKPKKSETKQRKANSGFSAPKRSSQSQAKNLKPNDKVVKKPPKDARIGPKTQQRLGNLVMLDDASLTRTMVTTKGMNINQIKRQEKFEKAYRKLSAKQRQLFSEYAEIAWQRVLSKLVKPPSDGKKHDGEIEFYVDENGVIDIDNVVVSEPSGSKALDDAFYTALLAVRKIQMPPDEQTAEAFYLNRLSLTYDEYFMLE